MEMNQLLSISMPTYNRADSLDYSLKMHIPLARAHNIQIYISDNASTDETRFVVEKWMKEYPLLQYSRNDHNVGAAKNVELALKITNSKYVWLVNDNCLINENAIKKVLEYSTERYDLIVLNTNNRVTNVESDIFKDCNILLHDLGWHLTLISGIVFSQNLIKKANFERYGDTNFPHIGAIFESLIHQKDINVRWLGNYSTKGINLKGVDRKSWQPRTFEVWIQNWSNCILSLPPHYTLENKLYTIAIHNEKTGLFNFKNLISLRSKNFYNLKILLKYKKYFPIALTKYSIIKFYFVLLMPISLLEKVVQTWQLIKNKIFQ